MLKKQKFKFLLFALLTFSVQADTSEEAIKLNLGSYVGRIWSDGSGVIGKPDDVNNFHDTWSFKIKKDEMTDEKIITTKRYAYKYIEGYGKRRLTSNISLWLNLSKPESEYLCVSGHDYPNKTATIRVDKNTPLSTNENGCISISSALNHQLAKGNQITIRGYHWPYEGAETDTISLGGYIKLTKFLRSKRLE